MSFILVQEEKAFSWGEVMQLKKEFNSFYLKNGDGFPVLQGTFFRRHVFLLVDIEDPLGKTIYCHLKPRAYKEHGIRWKALSLRRRGLGVAVPIPPNYVLRISENNVELVEMEW